MSDWTKNIFATPVHEASTGDRLTGGSVGVRQGSFLDQQVRQATLGERLCGDSQAVHSDPFGKPVSWK